MSAPSGAGKTTLCEYLVSNVPGVVRSVSMTTRPMRSGEKAGRDYFFVDKARFLKKIKNKEFLEYAEVFGQYYGTPADFVEQNLRSNKDVILAIDVQGAMKIKKKPGKNAVFVFILPPSMTDLKKRLMGRKTDSSRQIKQRLAVAKKELSYLNYYDYKVINDDVKTASAELKAIIIAARCRIK